PEPSLRMAGRGSRWSCNHADLLTSRAATTHRESSPRIGGCDGRGAGASNPMARLRLDGEDALADGDAVGAGLGAVGGALVERRDGREVAAELFFAYGEGRPFHLLLGVFEGDDQPGSLLTCQGSDVGGVAGAELGGKGDDGGAIVEGGEGAEGFGTSVEDVTLQDGD